MLSANCENSSLQSLFVNCRFTLRLDSDIMSILDAADNCGCLILVKGVFWYGTDNDSGII